MPRSMRSTCSASGIGCRSGSGRRRSCRSTASTPDRRDALVIGISQSGASPDIVAVIAAARAQGAPTIAITNEPDSPLAAAADRTIALGRRPGTGDRRDQDLHRRAARDRAARRPRSTDDPADRAAVAAHPRRARARPRRSSPRSSGSPRDQAAATGRSSSPAGFEYATAREWALKLKELARVFADPYSAADFQHGPLALVEPGVPVLAVARAGCARGRPDRAAGRLRDDLGAELMVVSDVSAALGPRPTGRSAPAGHPRVARARSSRSSRASSTRCI